MKIICGGVCKNVIAVSFNSIMSSADLLASKQQFS